ncbi:MAG: Maf family nucleotide pyrophosphatase [Flavobacteriaceae bacterium]|nr:Maf family nucleotide pyrophosphatase [Flavobacteriaceae bacterium]
MDFLSSYRVILGSGSPRRKALLEAIGISFEVQIRSIDETFPDSHKGAEITDYLAKLKASPFLSELKNNDILITSDTLVWHEGKALGKPNSAEEAKQMLRSLSGKVHQVITSVCFSTLKKQYIVNDTTKVFFKTFTEQEIDYYITHFKPFDKAGAYGIQEWIGLVGVERIEGSYETVVGFPVFLVYKNLQSIVESN